MIRYQSGFDATTVGAVAVQIRQVIGDLVEGEWAHGVLYMIRELVDNAVFHSGTNGGDCLMELSETHLHVVIRDRGWGIHHSLQQVYGAIDESTAVRWAFQGVSGTADDQRGIGLPSVLQRTETGIGLLLETGTVAFVGTQGEGYLIRKSTQGVEGVVATLNISRWMLRPDGDIG